MEFRLPDIGEGTTEGEIVRWLVREGDAVAEDQPIVEVMTDKATVELTSPKSGKIGRINARDGEVVPVGSVLVVIEEGVPGAPLGPGKEAHSPSLPPTAPPSRPVSVPEPTSPSHPSPSGPTPPHVLATPVVRKLARDLNVDLAFIRGSGPSGRVTPDDIQAAAASRRSAEAAAQAPVETTRPGEEERVPFRGIRRRIAERMVQSKQNAPHYTYMDEVDVTELVALRQTVKADAEKQGIKLTYLPFIIRAVVDGLRRYPRINATVDEKRNEIVLRRYYHVGIATATLDGLIVPVVKDADRRTLFGLAQEIERLATAARTGRIPVKDLQGGTFTISNVGSLGGLFATPIINYPEVAILAIHKISKRPMVRDNQIAIRDVLHMSISLDHRVVDGAEAVEFMNYVIRQLDAPRGLLG